jgi:hypothetical protein
MRVVRGTRLRTLLATLLVASMLFSIGELMVADVHDGDAAPAELASSSSPDAAPITLASGTESSTDPSQPEHTYHVCHCSHAHGGMLIGATHSAVRPPVAFTTGFGMIAAANTSLVASPPTRPPIA